MRQAHADENVLKVSTSVLGETEESAPKERRNYPGSHADLAGCEGETEWDIPDVGCCKLISKEGEGVSKKVACCS